MEKNHYTHLFTSALSQKEQRLVFEFKNETEFQDAAKKLQEKLDNPEISTPAAQAELKVLEVSAKLNSNPARRAKVDELIKGVREREDADRAVDAIKSKTAKGNPEWDAIVKGVKDKAGDAAEQAKQLDAAKKLITDSLADLKTATGAADKPYNFVKQIEAHAANIEKAKALDPAKLNMVGSTLTVVGPMVGVEIALADAALKKINDDHGTYMLSLEPLLDEAEGVDKRNTAGRNAAEKKVDDSANARRTALKTQLSAIGTSGAYNVEKQVKAVTTNINEVTKMVNDRLGRKTETAAAAPAAAPATAPDAAADKIDRPATSIKASVENNKITLNVEPKTADVKVTLPGGKVEILRSLNGVIVIDKAPNGEYKFESGTSTATVRVDVASGEPTEKVKEGLDKLLELFQKILEFLRGERIANGDVGTMQARLSEVKAKITKIKADKNFGTDNNLKKQVTDLEIEEKELELKIAEAKKVNSDVLRDAKGIVQGTPGSVIIVGQDGRGVFFRAAPGAPRDAAQVQMDYLVGRIEKRYQGKANVVQKPGIRQGVHVNINGPVYINSFNRTDNSRNIKVSGKNNTVSVQGSQNGNNEQDLRGGVSADASAFQATEGTVKKVQPRRVNIKRPPITGSLS